MSDAAKPRAELVETILEKLLEELVVEDGVELGDVIFSYGGTTDAAREVEEYVFEVDTSVAELRPPQVTVCPLITAVVNSPRAVAVEVEEVGAGVVKALKPGPATRLLSDIKVLVCVFS